jgi:hypothetical protein
MVHTVLEALQFNSFPTYSIPKITNEQDQVLATLWNYTSNHNMYYVYLTISLLHMVQIDEWSCESSA